MTINSHEYDPTDHQKATTRGTPDESPTMNNLSAGTVGETGSDTANDDRTGEADTDRDGFASYPAEVHALTHGVYMGLTTRPIRHPAEPDNPDVEKESHYYRGGYVVGTLFQLVIIGVLSVVAQGAM